MEPGIIIQARLGSKRLPGKALLQIAGRSILQHVIERCQETFLPVFLATCADSAELVDVAHLLGCESYIGKEDDVLDRVFQCAYQYRVDPIVRVTGDCPLIRPDLINRIVDIHLRQWSDPMKRYYLVSVAAGVGAEGEGNRWPDGFDAECIDFCALSTAWFEAEDAYDREHVTAYIWRTFPDRVHRLFCDRDRGNEKLSVDTWEDYERIRAGMEGDAS